MTDRPNFLFIMADQLSALALPAYGHPVVKAPHIDALARDGPDQLHGYEERLTTDIYPAGFSTTPDWSVEGPPVSGISFRGVAEAGVCKRNLQIDFDEDVHHAGLRKLYALGRGRQQRPFMLTVSYTQGREVEDAMRRRIDAAWDLAALEADVLKSQRRLRFVLPLLTFANARSWDYEPLQNAAEQYVRGGKTATNANALSRVPYVDPVPPDHSRPTAGNDGARVRQKPPAANSAPIARSSQPRSSRQSRSV